MLFYLCYVMFAGCLKMIVTTLALVLHTKNNTVGGDRVIIQLFEANHCNPS